MLNRRQRWPSSLTHKYSTWGRWVNTLRPRQNGRHFPDDIFKCIFLNENISFSITFSLKFVPRDPINNIPALVPIMTWRRPGDKPLSESMMASLLMHICVTRPQWVKRNGSLKFWRIYKSWAFHQNGPVEFYLMIINRVVALSPYV